MALLGHSKAKLWCEGRHNWQQQLLDFANSETSSKNNPRIWIHCASVGEFEQGRPIIEHFRRQSPKCCIILTFYSPSGYLLRKNYAYADLVTYLPLDTAHNAAFFIKTLRPTLAIFVKYEYWYYFLTTLHNQNIPTYLISAIFRPQQIFFKVWGGFFRNLLHKFTKIFVQDSPSEILLQSIGIKHVLVAGDTRFDRVYENAQQKHDLPIIAQFCADKKVIIAGSTWPPDEALLADFLSRTTDNTWALILVPHEIEENKIRTTQSLFTPKFPVLRYSTLVSQTSENAITQAFKNDLFATKVLLIDNIGMLSSIYYYGHYAYIGGGFGKGIHNSLEAVVYGKPVFWGPNYSKFREAHELISHKVAQSTSTADDLCRIVETMPLGSNLYKQTCQNAAQYVKENIGATQKIFEFLNKFLINKNK